MDILPQSFRGRVVKQELNKGSKKGKILPYIITECGKELVLRQKGKNPLEDKEIDALDGKKIQAVGIISSFVLVLDYFEEVE